VHVVRHERLVSIGERNFRNYEPITRYSTSAFTVLENTQVSWHGQDSLLPWLVGWDRACRPCAAEAMQQFVSADTITAAQMSRLGDQLMGFGNATV
jgi:hypothetical protein